MARIIKITMLVIVFLLCATLANAADVSTPAMYTVKAGNTLSKISRLLTENADNYARPWMVVVNPRTGLVREDKNTIYPGDEVHLPVEKVTTIAHQAKNESLTDICSGLQKNDSAGRLLEESTANAVKTECIEKTRQINKIRNLEEKLNQEVRLPNYYTVKISAPQIATASLELVNSPTNVAQIATVVIAIIAALLAFIWLREDIKRFILLIWRKIWHKPKIPKVENTGHLYSVPRKVEHVPLQALHQFARNHIRLYKIGYRPAEGETEAIISNYTIRGDKSRVHIWISPGPERNHPSLASADLRANVFGAIRRVEADPSMSKFDRIKGPRTSWKWFSPITKTTKGVDFQFPLRKGVGLTYQYRADNKHANEEGVS